MVFSLMESGVVEFKFILAVANNMGEEISSKPPSPPVFFGEVPRLSKFHVPSFFFLCSFLA